MGQIFYPEWGMTVNKSKKILLVLVFLLAVTGSFCGAFLLARNLYAVQENSVTAQKTAEISAYLERYFIDEYDENTLADAAAEAMVKATGDKWSYYLTAEEYQSYEESMNNAYVGIGVTITLDEEQGGMAVASVTPGGPAEEAGVQPGDIITAVGGEATIELGMQGTRSLVRGEEGTTVRLTIRRGEREFDLDVERRSILTDVATCAMLDGGIGYIHIANFDRRCAEETLRCIDELLAQDAKGIIFDVRLNGGGYKDELVKVLDRLLPEGILFQSEDYSGKKEIDRSDAEQLSLPMAVLVNQDSYSAAEFFAAALQEYGAAVIVGSRTTGKGNFQNAFRLSDGSLLNISIGKYYTPNGVSLTETGITPDIELDLSEEEYAKLYTKTLEKSDDPQLQAAIRALGENIS